MFIHTKGGTSKLDFHVFCRSKKKLSQSFFFYITKKLAQKLILAFSNSKKNFSKARFWHFLICRKKLAQKLSWRFLKRKTIAKKHILAYFQKQKMVQKQILAFSTIKKREVKSWQQLLDQYLILAGFFNNQKTSRSLKKWQTGSYSTRKLAVLKFLFLRYDRVHKGSIFLYLKIHTYMVHTYI